MHGNTFIIFSQTQRNDANWWKGAKYEKLFRVIEHTEQTQTADGGTYQTITWRKLMLPNLKGQASGEQRLAEPNERSSVTSVPLQLAL